MGHRSTAHVSKTLLSVFTLGVSGYFFLSRIIILHRSEKSEFKVDIKHKMSQKPQIFQ